MENFIIDIDNTELPNVYFAIRGEINKITTNKRFIISLNRLNYKLNNSAIIIPFREETQTQVLQEIQYLLSKFGLNYSLTDKTKKNVENFERENHLFENFALKAKSIRNKEFDKYPDLIENFKAFKSVLDITLHRTLYPLQELSAFHMAFSQNSCNFAVPGSGKTSIVYAAYSYLNSLPEEDPKHINKLLVVGPLSSFAPWEMEYENCFEKKTKFQRLSGDLKITKEKKLEHLYSSSPAEVSLIFHGGVDALQSDIINFLKKNKTMVVVDEAHRIKNPEGVWGKSIIEIAKEAKSRVILTGTPIPNGYQDIYNLFKFIYPFKYKEILNVHYQNLEDMTNNNDPESDRVQKLKENLSPFFIRIRKKDLKLPPIQEKIIPIEMALHQRAIYDFIEIAYIKSFKENNSGTVKDILNRAKLIRLRQAATNPTLLAKTLRDSLANDFDSGEYDPNYKFTINYEEYIDDSEFFNKICNYSKLEIPQKFVQLRNLLKNEILLNNGKAIIWSIFIQNAKDLKSYLDKEGITSKLLIGEIEQSEREITIKKFNNPEDTEFNVIIANPFSVAESISLHHGCHNAIYLERDYNCSNFLQSKDRIHRIGLTKNQTTNYYYLLSKDSIDEVINERINIKIERMEKIINDDIPLFNLINDEDETDIIKNLITNYAKRT